MKRPKKNLKADKTNFSEIISKIDEARREAHKHRPKITDKERLIWLFKLLLKQERYYSNLITIPFNELMVPPYFYNEKYDDISQDFCMLLMPVETDKDFFRKHNMLDYKPNFSLDNFEKKASFTDYTDDFLKTYLKYKLGVRYAEKNKNEDRSINKIEILEDKTEKGRINIYINSNYESEPMSLSRNKSWSKMYELAKTQETYFEKSFYDYFNHRQENPLYSKNGFEITKILKKQDGYIVPNIEIKLITQNQITRKLKSA